MCFLMWALTTQQPSRGLVMTHIWGSTYLMKKDDWGLTLGPTGCKACELQNETEKACVVLALCACVRVYIAHRGI